MTFLKFILARLSEPSTHAGLAVIFSLLGVPHIDLVWQVLGAATAVASIVVPENKGGAPAPAPVPVYPRNDRMDQGPGY